MASTYKTGRSPLSRRDVSVVVLSISTVLLTPPRAAAATVVGAPVEPPCGIVVQEGVDETTWVAQDTLEVRPAGDDPTCEPIVVAGSLTISEGGDRDPSPATDAAIAWAASHHPSYVLARHPRELAPEDSLSDWMTEILLPEPLPSVLFWLEPNPWRMYAHRSFVLLVTPDGGTVTEVPIDYWPVVNGDANTWGTGGSVDDSLVVARTLDLEAAASREESDLHIDPVPMTSVLPAAPATELVRSPRTRGLTQSIAFASDGGTESSCSLKAPCQNPRRFALVIRGHQTAAWYYGEVGSRNPQTWWDAAFAIVARFLGAVGVDEADLTVVGDSRTEITVAQVGQALDAIAARARCCDELIIWYLGHGQPPKDGPAAAGELVFSPSEVLGHDRLLQLLRTKLWGVPGGLCRVMVVADSCFASAFGDRLKTDTAATFEGSKGELVFIGSSGANESANVSNDGTYFATQAIAPLADAAADSPAPWDWERVVAELEAAANRRLSTWRASQQGSSWSLRSSVLPCCVCQSDDDCIGGGECRNCACELAGFDLATRQPRFGTCVSRIATGPCDDGLHCTVEDRCDAEGSCRGKAYQCLPQDVVNGAPDPQCGTSTCDESMSLAAAKPVCRQVPLCIGRTGSDGQPCCSDGNACTSDDLCDGSLRCVGQPKVCDDSNRCTSDYCEPETGECQHPRVEGASTCCVTNIDCDDGNPCTSDTCNAEQRCVHAATSGGVCDDGDDCTLGDSCLEGICRGGAPRDCSDGNQCTDDSCSDGACVHQPQTGTPCDDADACTVGDACVAGACVGNAGNCCDDSDCTTELACSRACNSQTLMCEDRVLEETVTSGGAFAYPGGEPATLLAWQDPSGIELRLAGDWSVTVRAPEQIPQVLEPTESTTAAFYIVWFDPSRPGTDQGMLPGGLTHLGLRGANRVIAIANSCAPGAVWQGQGWTWDGEQQGWVVASQDLSASVEGTEARWALGPAQRSFDPCTTGYKLLVVQRHPDGSLAVKFHTRTGTDPLGASIFPGSP